MVKIFISYHRASKDGVEQLVDDLKDVDQATWFDRTCREVKIGGTISFQRLETVRSSLRRLRQIFLNLERVNEK